MGFRHSKLCMTFSIFVLIMRCTMCVGVFSSGWLGQLSVANRATKFSLLHSHLPPFWLGIIRVHSVHRTLVICWNPSGRFLGFYSVSSGTLGALSPLKFSVELGSRSSGILVTCTVHLSCTSFKRVCTLCIPAFSGLLCRRFCLAIWFSGVSEAA